MVKNILLFIFALSTLVQANENKVKTIACEPSLLYKCTMQQCEKIEVVNIDGVQSFEIDLEQKMLTGKIGETEVYIENVTSRHGNKNTFIFFGTHADSKFDWMLRIDKKTGKLVLLATNEDLVGFTVYGTCQWKAEK